MAKKGVIYQMESILRSGWYTYEELGNMIDATPSEKKTHKRQCGSSPLSKKKYEEDGKGIVLHRETWCQGRLVNTEIKVIPIV